MQKLNKRSRRNYLLATAAAAASAGLGTHSAHADVFGYNFGTTAPVYTHTSGTTTNFSDGNGFTIGNSYGTVSPDVNTTSSSSFTYTTPAPSKAENIGNAAVTGALNTATSADFLVTLTPTAGYALTLSEFDFGIRSTSTGPQAYSLVATDGVAADTATLATGTVPNNSTAVYETNAFAAKTFTTGDAVTLTLYVYNGVGNASSGSVNVRLDDISITATAGTGAPPTTPTVESFDSDQTANATFGVNGGNTTISGSTPAVTNFTTDLGAEAAYNSSLYLAFKGTAGTVTIDPAGITNAGGAISITSNGYIITGGQISLAASTSIFTDAADTATIASILASTGVITKTGAGTLVLAGANTYSGGTNVNAGILAVTTDSNLGTGAVALGGGTLSTLAAISSSKAFSGSGTINTNGYSDAVGEALFGGLTLAGGGSFNFNGFTNATATQLTILAPTTIVVGSGTLTTNSISYFGTGTETITANLVQKAAGSFTVAPAATLELSGQIGTYGMTLTGGGTLLLDDTSGSDNAIAALVVGAPGSTVSGGTLSFNGASALGAYNYSAPGTSYAISVFSGTLNNAGPAIDTPERYLNFALATVTGSATTLSGYYVKSTSTTVSGTVTTVSTTTANGAYLPSAAATASLTASTDVTFNSALGDVTTFTGAGLSFAGAGSITLQAASGFKEVLNTSVATLNVNAALTATPSVDITAGTVNVGAAGTLGLGNVTVVSGAHLHSSTSTAVADSATITADGNGALVLDSGVLESVSTAILGGTTYSIIGSTIGSLSNTATTYQSAEISGAGELQIVMAPEPASLSLVVIAGSGLLARRRRRRVEPTTA